MDSPAARPAGLARRLAASGYEGLLLAAMLIGIGFALLPLVTPAGNPAGAPMSGGVDASRSLYTISPGARRLSAAVIFAACAFYCAWFWSGGRRSLPMKTWRLVLRSATGGTVSLSSAALRYVACWTGPALAIAGYQALQPLGQGRWAWALLAVNYAWALIDRERQFLQDRVAGTRLMLASSGCG